jgi:hypothetical protein
MVLDRLRTEAYARAIAAVVKPGDVVLDIGTGSGLLALLAAKAGARRVFAVERTRIHELARIHVREQGLEGIVEVIHDDLLDLDRLPEPPTVIIGEVFGHFAPDENVHALYQHAMSMSAPGARILPESYCLTMGLVSLEALRNDLAYLASGLPVTLHALADRLVRCPKIFATPAESLLGDEVDTPVMSLLGESPTSFGATLPINRDGNANGIVVGFRATLAEGVRIDTNATSGDTSWLQVVFPIESMPVRAGESVTVNLKPRLLADYTSYAWSVRGPVEVRECDGLDAHGDLTPDEFARAMGIMPKEPVINVNRQLRVWSAALQGGADVSFQSLVTRVRDSMPEEFDNDEDARRAVVELLVSAGAVAL